jgi:hypothetical protein
LQVLDPEYPYEYPILDKRVEAFTRLSNPEVIPQNGNPGSISGLEIFGNRSGDQFCESYNKADFARQLGDWPEVIRQLKNTPDTHPEFTAAYFFPLIQAYAMNGEWDEVISTFQWSLSLKGSSPAKLEALWNKIDGSTPNTPDKIEAQNRWQELLDKFRMKFSE